jgi:enoyl-CoA hydratase
MSSETVTIERRDSVLVCHLDDGKANALSKGVIADIGAVLREAEADDSISAMVLHGRPGTYSGGFDLAVMRGGDIAAISDLVCDGGDLVRSLYGASVPVVAACTGHALAAGALLLLGCDVRVGADIDCKIGLSEVAIGMVLPQWALTIAADRLSKRHLQRVVANARLRDGRGSVDVGFLDEVAPAEEVLDVAVARARELDALDADAYAATVAVFRGPVLSEMADQIASDRAAGAAPTR